MENSLISAEAPARPGVVSKSSSYITTLTPLRGIAALMIVIYHGSGGLLILLTKYTKFVQNAHLWVDFFFVLSGFIMSYVYHQEFSNRVSLSKYKSFIGARFARIYPLHFFTTIWAFICCAIILHYATSIDPDSIAQYDLKSLPGCLLLLNGFPIYSTFPLNVPSWSLSTEWWMYLLFPFLVPLMLRLKLKWRIISLVAVFLFYCVFVFYTPVNSWNNWLFGHMHPVTSYAPFSKCVAGFVLGMLLYTFFRESAGYSVIKRDWFFVASLLGAVCAMHFNLTPLTSVVCFALMILSAAYNSGRVKRVLDTAPLQQLGNWSFSIYLVHFPVIYMYSIFDVRKDPRYLAESIFLKPQNQLQNSFFCLQLVVITLILSALLWRYLEIPARNYLNKVFGHRQVMRGMQSHQ